MRGEELDADGVATLARRLLCRRACRWGRNNEGCDAYKD